MRLTGFILLVVLSLGVALSAVTVYSLMPVGAMVHPDLRVTHQEQRVALLIHVFAAAVALALGPFQFSARLRTRRPGWHRSMGRVYLGIGILFGGVSGAYMALHAFGGGVARLGFGCLALAWLSTGWCAFRSIRSRDVVAHRRWMVRNFALTFAAVTLRLYVSGSVISGVAFEAAYPVIAWLCWLPNLVVAEFAFNRTR